MKTLRTPLSLGSLLVVALGCTPGEDSPLADTEGTSSTGAETSGDMGTTDAEPPPAPESDDGSSSGDGSGSDTGGPAQTSDEGTGSDETAGDTTTGEPAECPGAMVCMQSAPEGWTGPYELSEAEADVECTGFYSDVVWEGGSLPAAADGTCECGCEVGSASCNPVGGLYYFPGGCGTADAEWFELDPDATIGEPAPAGLQAYAYSGSGGQNSATCQSQVDSASFPAPTFELAAVACEFPGTQFECDGGSCMPPADAGELCILHYGDVACPEGPYQDRRVHFEGIDDSRSCGCDCEAEVDDCPSDLVIVQTLLSTGGVTATPIVAENECTTHALPGTVLSATFIPSAPVASCEATGNISGGIAAVEPWTACCA